MKKVIKQRWMESELHWGIRPDGYSLHLTADDLEKYINEYWKSMPKEVPNEYSRPEGNSIIVEVNEKIYKKIQKSKNGIRLWK